MGKSPQNTKSTEDKTAIEENNEINRGSIETPNVLNTVNNDDQDLESKNQDLERDDHGLKKFKSTVIKRTLRAANYVSIYLFILITYGGALITDYIIFALIWGLLGADIEKYPVIKSVVEYIKIGLALLFVFSAFIHGIFSTYSQIKLDLSISKEDGENYG